MATNSAAISRFNSSIRQQIIHVLAGDRGHGQIQDVQLLLPDEVEQQVQGPVEGGQVQLQVPELGSRSPWGARTRGVLGAGSVHGSHCIPQTCAKIDLLWRAPPSSPVPVPLG